MTHLAVAQACGDLWERTRFRPRQAFQLGNDSQFGDDSRHDVLEPLYLGYGSRPRGPDRKASGLTSPSAGSLYPFEVYCRICGDDAVALYDPVTMTLQRSEDPPEGVRHLLAVDDHESAATLALLLRPWASIRKYGLRGYFYTHLDGAHALASIVRAAEALGRQVGVWLPAENRESHDGREAYAVVSLGRARVPVIAAGPPERDSGRPSGESIETMVWNRLRAFGAGAPWQLARDSATFPLLAGGKADPQQAAPWDVHDWARRRSAHSFDKSASVSMSAVAHLIEGLPQEFPGNLSPAAARPYVRVVEPASGDRDGTVWELSGGRLRLTGPCRMTGEDFVAACVGQRVVEHASALVVYVVGRRRLKTMSEVTAALLCSGVVSAQFYLACTHLGYGCTCIGAYDSVGFRDHRVISDDEDVVNVTAVGMTGPELAEKVDRTQFALRTGEATW